MLSLKKNNNENKKKCKPPKNCLTYIARDRKKTLKNEKEKRKMRKR